MLDIIRKKLLLFGNSVFFNIKYDIQGTHDNYEFFKLKFKKSQETKLALSNYLYKSLK